MNEQNSRFTLDGSYELESRVRTLCLNARKAVQGVIPSNELQALILGGGYGRGEGGVLRVEEGEVPYNDLEFYVCVSGSELLARRKYTTRLHDLAERLTHEAGIEMELKLFSLDKLRRSPITMFYYDLVSGHKWVLGEEGLLDGCRHHLVAPRIPLHEATRLLMNRCSGLLFGKERLRRDPFTLEDADFVRRNIAKAQLALGDVILTAYGQYHWSCRERHKRLSKFEVSPDLPWLEELVSFHREGVEFKLHPFRSSEEQEELVPEWEKVTRLARVIWFWLEGKRLKRPFADAHAYTSTAQKLCPESHPAKNFLINCRTFGAKGCLGSGAFRYPRERLLRTLPILLWEPEPFPELSVLEMQSQLRTNAHGFPELVKAYKCIWSQYN